MAEANKISVVISAVDKVSGKLEEINKRMEKFMQPARRMQASMKRLADATGVTRLRDGLRGLNRAAKDTFQSIGKIIEPLAVITGAASLAGLYKLTTGWAQFNFQISTSAQNMGVSASQLVALEGASRLAGSGSQALASGMQALGTNLWNAVGGRSPQTISALRYLGYSFSDVDKMSGNLSAALPQLADKISAIKNPFGQAAVATALFGSAGVQLLPFLRLGAKGIEEYEKKAEAYGLFNKKGIAAANELRLAQANLSMAVQGLGYSIAQALAPVLEPLLTQMSNWIAKNREWIATKITTYVKEFISWVQKVWPEINKVVDAFGGWGKAAKDLAEFMGAAWLATMLAPIASVALSIAGLIASIKAAQTASAALQASSGAGGGGSGAGALAGLGAAGMLARSSPLAYFMLKTAETASQGVPISNIPYYQNMKPAALPTGSALQVLNQGMGYFMSQGWTKQQAAGLMANAQRESNFDPNAVNTADGSVHRGLFQWDSDRWGQLVKMFGPNPTASQQLQFAQWELTNSPDFSGVGAALKKSQDALAATALVNAGYEKSGDSMSGLKTRFEDGLAYAAGPFVPMPATVPVPPPTPSGPAVKIGNGSASAAASPINGSLDVSVTHKNPPPGTTASVTSNIPGVKITPLRVQYSMAGGGL